MPGNGDPGSKPVEREEVVAAQTSSSLDEISDKLEHQKLESASKEEDNDGGSRIEATLVSEKAQELRQDYSEHSDDGADQEVARRVLKKLKDENYIEKDPDKKKKRKKPKAKPTGFEEYYVDPPTTPEEHLEEQGLYDVSRSFEERIQTAIQRYSAKRKFGEIQKTMFDKYLSFGGIDVGPNMFGGGTDAGASTDLDAADIAQLKATKYISQSVLNGDADVDFTGVLEAFLSCHLAHYSTDTKETIKARVHVIRNFLNYLLHHDVCPEYLDDINAARRVCDTAESEIWLINQCSSGLLPGEFNQACSLLFGSSDKYKTPTGWIYGKDCGDMTIEQARKIFIGALAVCGSDAVQEQYTRENDVSKARTIGTVCTWIEVTHIVRAGQNVKDMYTHAVMHGCRPVGKLIAQTWYNPAAPPEDLTEEEEKAKATEVKPVLQYEFWVEDAILANMFRGMKFECTVHELSFGVHYFGNVTSIQCSFYRYIPNIDMIGWKEPRYLPRRETYGPNQLQAYLPEDVAAVDD